MPSTMSVLLGSMAKNTGASDNGVFPLVPNVVSKQPGQPRTNTASGTTCCATATPPVPRTYMGGWFPWLACNDALTVMVSSLTFGATIAVVATKPAGSDVHGDLSRERALPLDVHGEGHGSAALRHAERCRSD